jgi:aspartate/methionine/tyrosine aminotransferase
MNAPLSHPPVFPLRREAEDAPASGIVEAMTYGRGRPGLIPLWAGEGDLPTPAFINEAAARSLAAGETFYTWQRGIPELREALARYHERLYRRPFAVDRFSVTVGGMHAAQIACRMAAGSGDEVLIPTPAWPNFHGALTVAGARPVPVPMTGGPAGWTLDTDRLQGAVTARTRAIVVNSPANPTGWTASRDDLTAILAIARRHGLWIIADEIYARFVFDPALTVDGRAPSFRDVMEADDRILFVQTFSKNWAMTGWRIGWLEAPPALGPTVENLIQYSTSGVAAFLQRAAVAALEEGGDFADEQIARARRGRAIVCDGLNAAGRVELPAPPGAFYAFLRVPGVTDSRALALRIIDEANVGLAPGSAFGAGGEAYLRLCFARKAEDLEEVVRRLAPVLERLPG